MWSVYCGFPSESTIKPCEYSFMPLTEDQSDDSVFEDVVYHTKLETVVRKTVDNFNHLINL